MTGMLREPLNQDQLHLLQAIFEPFAADGQWPIWQYVDLQLDQQFGINAATVLASLPSVGSRGPTSLTYSLVWRDDHHMAPRAETPIALTVAGLRYVDSAGPLLSIFTVLLRHMIQEQSQLVPDPRQVVQATVGTDAVVQQVMAAGTKNGAQHGPFYKTPKGNFEVMMRQAREMLSHEPFLYGTVQHPYPDRGEQWTVRVPAVLRAYRGITTVDDYLDRVTELVAPAEAPSVPPTAGPLDLPTAVGYLDAVWKAKTGSRLFAAPDILSAARLTLTCRGEEEFNSLMSALADVLGQAVVPGNLKPPDGALETVRDWLAPQVDRDVADRLEAAFGRLITLRRLRVSQQHSDARYKAVAAFREMGQPFPPASWETAWTQVVALARGALDVIREEVSAALPDQ